MDFKEIAEQCGMEIKGYIPLIDSPKELDLGFGEVIQVIQDPKEAAEELKKGHKVARFEYGDSMMPIFYSGEYAVLTPKISPFDIHIGDAVFCELNGYYMTHMVLNVSDSAANEKYYLIGNTALQPYGWVPYSKVYAKAKGTRILKEWDTHTDE
jgi:hypothetical protein